MTIPMTTTRAVPRAARFSAPTRPTNSRRHGRNHRDEREGPPYLTAQREGEPGDTVDGDGRDVLEAVHGVNIGFAP
jgi:hypothetical protein